MNKYVATVDNQYDQYTVYEFIPFTTEYTIQEIFDEQKRIFDAYRINKKDWLYNKKEFFKIKAYFGYHQEHIPILDTNIKLQSESSPIVEILSVDEWFEKYSKG